MTRKLIAGAVAPSRAWLRQHFEQCAAAALSHLGRRPLGLVRHAAGKIFYDYGPLPALPREVHQISVRLREGDAVQVWVDSIAGLLGLVEVGAVEIHPWACVIDDVETPNALTIDIDPGPGVEWSSVVETALAVRSLYAADGLNSWAKLTGKKGLHIVAPLSEKVSWGRAMGITKRLAHHLARGSDLLTTEAALAARAGRIYLDCTRNAKGATTIGAYSPRARPGFPIARAHELAEPRSERAFA